ncbi:MAG: MBL fold metallo-hydrolase [Megasphaera sp.]|jgi:7,8-dihydropterin-6-yl-methyl-4-(beta-D-ribofuranosyl)aminobenzene 5'-phosphate synthase|uniref:MBL fold metallo-hydrolase n=1 Tax=Megasphaera sueciensis TaxID=349094 RepID=UPI003D092569|nr:MBL fold metallo-hydrolase [Megasphaera sp.]MCI1822341.1 MBL fold metallo-hydrolase [Megasphaera sp.]
MKLVVLVDNNTIIDHYFLGEPASSYYLEEGDIKLLFDVGYTDIFIKNAQKMNINLDNVNTIVLSHGHNDHVGGLADLIRYYAAAFVERGKYNKPRLIAHPLAFCDKYEGKNEIGSVIKKHTLQKHFNVTLSKDEIWLTDKLVFLGEIKRRNNFENKQPIGKVMNQNSWVDDFMLDDSALVYKSCYGLVIITGCSHAGICNIIEQAKIICKETRIVNVIGGFHLLNPEEHILEATCHYMKQNNIQNISPCHCTDLNSKIALSKDIPIREVGVGTLFEYN